MSALLGLVFLIGLAVMILFYCLNWVPKWGRYLVLSIPMCLGLSFFFAFFRLSTKYA